MGELDSSGLTEFSFYLWGLPITSLEQFC
jgi:hypothetical protein